jgi:hypothetical protein
VSADRSRRSSRLVLWRDEARIQLDRVLATLRIGRASSQRPLPRVGIAFGAWLPAWVLRGGVAGVALACAALLTPGPGLWAVAVLGALAVLVLPGGAAVAFYAFALGFGLAVAGGPGPAIRPYLMLFGVHLFVTLGRTVGVAPWSSRVDLHVLVPPLRRLLALQVLVQPLALVGAILTSAAVSVPWVPVLVGVGLAVLGWWLLSQLIPLPRRISG